MKIVQTFLDCFALFLCVSACFVEQQRKQDNL